MPYATTTGERSGIPVLSVSGELDLAAHPELERVLTQLAGGGNCVILNLLDVSYTDGSPIGLLIKVHHDLAARGGALAIVCCQHEVRRVLHTAGLIERFDVFDDLDEAVAYVKGLC